MLAFSRSSGHVFAGFDNNSRLLGYVRRQAREVNKRVPGDRQVIEGKVAALEHALRRFSDFDLDGKGLLTRDDLARLLERDGLDAGTSATLRFLYDRFLEIASSHARTAVRVVKRMVQPERTMFLGRAAVVLPPMHTLVREPVQVHYHAIAREDLARRLKVCAAMIAG